MFDFGRGLCNDLTAAQDREWLVTNGLGGYASGTVAGPRTRSYHGLLVAALNPPLGRTLLASHVDETLRYDGGEYTLFTHRWNEETVQPQGYVLLDRFHLEGTVPVWTYSIADALLEKRVWMADGAQTTYIQYSLLRARSPATLHAKAFVNHRNHHGTTQAGDWQMNVTKLNDGLRVDAFDGTKPLFLRSSDASASPEHTWHRSYYLALEASRGLDAEDDALHAGTFKTRLAPDDTLTLAISTAPNASLDGAKAFAARRSRDDRLVEQAGLTDAPPDLQHLARAADQFVVARPTKDVPDGRTIMAGYPWFGDWGRDTMIALPGLTLVTGRPDVAEKILRTYGRYVNQGLLPNRFPDDAKHPEYNTVDATLWYVEAIRAYFENTGDTDLLRDLWPTLTSIVEWHEKGTRYGIQVDTDDGLLRAGEPGVQLTWMDAKVGDWVVTPRIGKPVEVNALWYNALRILATFAETLGEDAAPLTKKADRVASHFDQFWDADRGYCLDVIDGPNGDNPSLRPNQIFAVSLPHSPLSDAQKQAVVDTCAAHLYTPHGLRSLEPTHSDYVGMYSGGRTERDGAYHQGTVWSWLAGPFAIAHYRVYDDAETARSFLTPLRRHLGTHGVGSVSEIFDGDAPFHPRGTPAQAWGVAQLLAAWFETNPIAELEEAEEPISKE